MNNSDIINSLQRMYIAAKEAGFKPVLKDGVISFDVAGDKVKITDKDVTEDNALILSFTISGDLDEPVIYNDNEAIDFFDNAIIPSAATIVRPEENTRRTNQSSGEPQGVDRQKSRRQERAALREQRRTAKN